jgi:hypothetical protein
MIIDEPLLQDIVDAIVQEVDPETIILFGSRARGDALPDSDVDLLIVEKEPFTLPAVQPRVQSFHPARFPRPADHGRFADSARTGDRRRRSDQPVNNHATADSVYH